MPNSIGKLLDWVETICWPLLVEGQDSVETKFIRQAWLIIIKDYWNMKEKQLTATISESRQFQKEEK